MRTLLLQAVLISGIITPIRAQIPGYLGQRNTLAVSVYTFPNAREFLRGTSGLGFNGRAELGWEHVFSRRMSLRSFLGGFQTQLGYERAAETGKARIEAQVLGVEMRFFNLIRRGNLAPIGPYQSVSFSYLRYTARDLDGRFRPGDTALGRYGDWVLALNVGTQRIIRERLFFHIGMQGAWVMNLFRPDLPDWQTEIRGLSIGRLRGHLALNFMGGIGVFLPQRQKP
ncbi:MAG: hypothetical protein AAFV07_08315 [Bacteroidota bacterium]